MFHSIYVDSISIIFELFHIFEEKKHFLERHKQLSTVGRLVLKLVEKKKMVKEEKQIKLRITSIY